MVTDIWSRLTDPRRCFIIAEAGVNHNGDTAMALRLVDAAVAAGADAVKFQTFKAERIITLKAPKAEYQKADGQTGESQFAMLKRLELSEENHRKIQAHCRERGILFFSTPFDESSADFLEGLGVGVFKVPSGELTNTPLLEHIARKGRPVILSTGMADLAEVETAVAAVRAGGNGHLVLLHCVSQYPAPPETVNLRAMTALKDRFHVPVGFSDHTLGIAVSLAAAALGARVIEKHFTLDKNLSGPDHRASLDPSELCSLVAGVRTVESSLGTGVKLPAAGERKIAEVARKSLVAACAIPAGTVIGGGHVAVKRPGTGLAPGLREQIIGRRARRDIAPDELLDWGMLL